MTFVCITVFLVGESSLSQIRRHIIQQSLQAESLWEKQCNGNDGDVETDSDKDRKPEARVLQI